MFSLMDGMIIYKNRKHIDTFLRDAGVKDLLLRCRIAEALSKLFLDEVETMMRKMRKNTYSFIPLPLPKAAPIPIVKIYREEPRGLLLKPSSSPRFVMEGISLEINPTRPSNEPAILIPPYLSAVIKPHQLAGIRFLWRTVIQEAKGSILAHAMGLGKTIQSIAFLHTLLCELSSDKSAHRQSPLLPTSYSSRFDHLPKVLRFQRPIKILILCPPIVIQNWEAEFQLWIPEKVKRSSPLHAVYRMKGQCTWQQKLDALGEWHKWGGIFLLGYQMYRQMLVKGEKALGKASYSLLREYLLSPGPSLLIADEGHVIKNVKGTLAHIIKQTETPLRICLTGYPLQNNLPEYWCMVDFCRPGFLGDLQRFRHSYVNPINNGSLKDASLGERKYAAKRLFVLTRLIDHFVSRMDQKILLDAMSSEVSKHEYVLSCRMTPLQRELYELFLETRGRVFFEAMFAKTVMLTRILNHPAILKMGFQQEDDFVVSGEGSDMEQEAEVDPAVMDIRDWASEKMRLNDLMSLHHSYKMETAMQLLRAFKRVGDKCLLFSRSIPTLDYVCETIETENSKASNGLPITYFRMDGMTQNTLRQTMIQRFNSKNQDEVDVFIISIMTGSLGINLTRANRVILLDVGWNPCHDEQAIGRSFRFGQTRPVFVYRLQCYGTIEERLYRLNVHKAGMSKRVIDKQNIEKHYTKEQMTKYFSTPLLPEEDMSLLPIAEQLRDESTGDVVLDQILLSSGMGIVKWFHHHSLLEESRVDELTAVELAEAGAELEGERLKLTLINDKDGKGLLSGIGRPEMTGSSSSGEDIDGMEEYISTPPASTYYHKRGGYKLPMLITTGNVQPPITHYATPELKRAELAKFYAEAQAMRAASALNDLNRVQPVDASEASSQLPSCDDIFEDLSRDCFEDISIPTPKSRRTTSDQVDEMPPSITASQREIIYISSDSGEEERIARKEQRVTNKLASPILPSHTQSTPVKLNAITIPSSSPAGSSDPGH